MLTTVPNGTDIAIIKEVIDRDGGIIISDYASSEMIDELNAKLEPHFKAAEASKHMEGFGNVGVDFFPVGTVHIYGTWAKAPQQVLQLVRNPHHTQIMEQYLNGSYSFMVGQEKVTTITGWQYNVMAALRVNAGAKPQVLHRDHTLHCVPQETGTTYTSLVGCLVAGTDSLEENGATRVIPGSHLWPWDRCPKPEESVPAVMKKGSALFWLGSTYHGAGHNQMQPGQPNSVRTLYGLFGCRDYLRSEENHILANPWEDVKDLPTDVLGRMGYGKAVGGTGFVQLGHGIDGFEPLSAYRKSKGYDDTGMEAALKPEASEFTRLSGQGVFPPIE